MVLETLILIYVLIWVIPCMIIASAKNKSLGMAFIASLFFGIFALIYYIFAGRETSKEEKHTVKCSDCGAEVSKSDEFCPECGTKVVDSKFCTECCTSL